jgi:hypothetical protein
MFLIIENARKKKFFLRKKKEKTEKNVPVICVLFAGVIDDEKEKKTQLESCFLFMFDEDVIYISSSTILLPF